MKRNVKGQFVKGNKFSKEILGKMRMAQLGKKQSLEHRMKKGKKGDQHWNWKGGITLIRKRLMESFQYRLWRSDVFTRDNFTCTLCGKHGGWIEADHFPKPYVQIRNEYGIKTIEEALSCEELWNINNGRTLCRNCHNKNKTWKKWL